MIATSGFLTALECTKSIFGRGSAPDPAGGVYSSSPDSLAGFKGSYFGKGREGRGRERKGRGGERKGRRGGKGKEGMPPNCNSWIRPCPHLIVHGI